MTTRCPCVSRQRKEVLVFITVPRYREVVTTDQGVQIGMRVVAQLSERASTHKLRSLISGDQLVVSPDGSCAAHVATFRLGYELVVHSELGVVKPHFQRVCDGDGTRILEVGRDSVLVLGNAVGHPRGVWRIRGPESTFIGALDFLTRTRGNAGICLRGWRNAEPGIHRVFTPMGGMWGVDQQAMVEVDAQGLCVIEPIGGILYAYRLSAREGVRLFRPLTLQRSERAVGITQWLGRLMLAIVRGSQSWLVELSQPTGGPVPERIHIDGKLQELWAAPNGASLAFLLHPRGAAASLRRLELHDGTVIHEGRFRLDRTGVGWSPNGKQLIAKVCEGGTAQCTRSSLVGTACHHVIPPSLEIRQMLVDDHGALTAFIQSDGMYDQPVVGGRAQTMVPIAWNLHTTPDGKVSWTTIHDDRILTWTQRLRARWTGNKRCARA